MDLQTIQQAIKQIATEKGLAEDSILETINSALAAAYRKDFGDKNQNIIFEFDPKSGKMKVYDKKTVVDFPEEIIKAIDENGRDKKFVREVDAEGKPIEPVKEEVKEDDDNKKQDKETKKEQEEPEDHELSENAIRFNPKTDILLEDAKKIKKSAKVGDEIIQDLEIPEDFGRMAAQTAKQVIIQKIREAERETLFNEFKDREGELVIGVVQRKDPRGILVDIGKTAGILRFEDQIRGERYNPGDRMKFYVKSVEKTIKGPEIILSRASAEMIKKLFETEIPEIAAGSIDIMGVAREAGARSKVAVKSNQENIDPIGSCVGQRGARIQTIINELGGEKIDIIEYDEDMAKFITNALSPANVAAIDLAEKENTATVTVVEDQLSLAIGKEGQNVRLAAKLTGWKINILKETATGKKEKVELGETSKAKEKESSSASQEADKNEVSDDKDNKEKKETKTKKKTNTKEDKEKKTVKKTEKKETSSTAPKESDKTKSSDDKKKKTAKK